LIWKCLCQNILHFILMMGLRGLVLVLLFRPSGAHRSIRIANFHQIEQQQSDVIANSLEVSAESQETLIPGGYRTGSFRPAGVARAHVSGVAAAGLRKAAAPAPRASGATPLVRSAPDFRAPVAPRRAVAPTAGFFDDLGKIVEYNKKFVSTAVSGLFDQRTAKASHILFGFDRYGQGAADGAAKLKERLATGEISFEDAAAEFSTCPSRARGGDLGTFKRAQMVPEFDAVCFDDTVALNEVVGPVKTQFGFHLIKVAERSAKDELSASTSS